MITGRSVDCDPGDLRDCAVGLMLLVERRAIKLGTAALAGAPLPRRVYRRDHGRYRPVTTARSALRPGTVVVTGRCTTARSE